MSQLHRGIVIDAHDPDDQLRLKVYVPSASREREIWALPFVAERRVSVPSKGTSVWVWLEYGDIERAIWINVFA